MMSRTRTVRPTAAAALAVVGLLQGGCFFEDDVVSVNTETGEEAWSVSISKTGVTAACSEDTPLSFTCQFAGFVSSTMEMLSPAELLFLLILLDPMVVQFPDDVTVSIGSWVHFDSGDAGNLTITDGLASVPVDDTRTLTAEPGTQLVILDLPAGAPTTGDFGFNLQLTVPPGTTEVVTKPLFTGRIELTDGSVFYPPLFPCVSDMAQVPTFTIPVSEGSGEAPIPALDPALACDGEVYAYGGAEGPGSVLEIPTLGLAGLMALALLLAGVGWLIVRR